MIALRQVISLAWGKPQAMSDCVAFGGEWQSYHNVPKALITFVNGKIITLNSISTVLFTFNKIYGIIQLLDKLEFDEVITYGKNLE